MSSYRVPLRDMPFVLRELARVAVIAKLPRFEAAPDVLDAILEEASTFATEVLDPINRTFYAAKLGTAGFYIDRVLSQARWPHHEIADGSAYVVTLTDERFDLDRQTLMVA